MSVTLIDFCGFSFNGHHSSEMGLVRVSDGSRYEDLVGANFQDKTATVPGLDGTYFFESNYTQKPFTINVAFDSVTEEQLRMIREVFNGKDMGPLIFDECPYKAYVVKLQSPVQLKYICFDKLVGRNNNYNNYSRVYKGEGTIQFIAYESYAHSVYKYLNQYSNEYTNKSEWATASRMRAATQEDGKPTLQEGILDDSGSSSTNYNVYNAGDIPTDFKIYYTLSNIRSQGVINLDLIPYNTLGIVETLRIDCSKIRAAALTNEDMIYILIDTKTHLIEGCDVDYNPMGILLNDAIISGDFFKIPTNYWRIRSGKPIKRIEYEYLYY